MWGVGKGSQVHALLIFILMVFASRVVNSGSLYYFRALEVPEVGEGG